MAVALGVLLATSPLLGTRRSRPPSGAAERVQPSQDASGADLQLARESLDRHARVSRDEGEGRLVETTQPGDGGGGVVQKLTVNHGATLGWGHPRSKVSAAEACQPATTPMMHGFRHRCDRMGWIRRLLGWTHGPSTGQV